MRACGVFSGGVCVFCLYFGPVACLPRTSGCCAGNRRAPLGRSFLGGGIMRDVVAVQCAVWVRDNALFGGGVMRYLCAGQCVFWSGEIYCVVAG